MSGSGCNFQKHCHRAVFLGIDYKFNDFIQAIHRIYRFLQQEQVIIDVIYTEDEENIKTALLEKWKNHDHLVRKMVEAAGYPGQTAGIFYGRSAGKLDR